MYYFTICLGGIRYVEGIHKRLQIEVSYLSKNKRLIGDTPNYKWIQFVIVPRWNKSRQRPGVGVRFLIGYDFRIEVLI